MVISLAHHFISTSAFSQGVAINTTGAVAYNSAMLDITSTTASMLNPRIALTATNAADLITSPAANLLVYQTDGTPGYYYNSGTQALPMWISLFSVNTGWALIGNAGITDAKDFAIYTNNAERIRVLSGAIISTPCDLNKFLHNLFNKSLLSDSSINVMKTLVNEDMRHGLIYMPYDNHKGYGYTGRIDEYHSETMYFPEDSISISVFANGLDGWFCTSTLMAYYFNKKSKFPESIRIRLPKEEMSKYDGTYRLSILGIPVQSLKVVSNDNVIFIAPKKRLDKEKQYFEPCSPGLFKREMYGINIKFILKKNVIILFILLSVAIKAQIPNTLSKTDKIYGLSKFWQEVNYNFIYLDKVDRIKWDSAYRALIMTVQETPNDYEYYRELKKFCALLKDGHTTINFPKSVDTLIYNSMFGAYRIFLKNIDGKAIVVRTNQSNKNELPIGSEILEVNGLPTPQYINLFVAPYISSSTDYVLQDKSVEKLFEGMNGQKYEVKVKVPDGKIKTLSLTHEKTLEKEVYPPFEDRQLLNFKWYDNQIAYISLNSFADPEIDTLFIQKLPELYKAKGLIIDLRFNDGGNTSIGTEILQYLTFDTIFYGAKSSSRLHIPVYKAWGRYVKPGDTTEWAKKSTLCSQDKYYYSFDYTPDTFRTKKSKINIPTAILIGHNTVSASEDFLIYTDNQKHIVKIGENSCGSTGEAFVFDIPGNGSAKVCTKKDIYPDGREFVGYGVKPDIEVKPTLNDYIQNKDPVIDRALFFLKTKMK